MLTMEDRDALYYPVIHVRNLDWLKATLLRFPQVRRVVPPDFQLNDTAASTSLASPQGDRS